MNQSRLESLIETLFNTVIGFSVALLSQILVFPLFNIHVPISTNFGIGAWFTLISVARGYTIRRWFNARLKNAAHALAATIQETKP